MIGATQDGWLLGWDRIPGRDSGTWAPDNEDAPKIVAHTTEGYTIGDAVNAFHANNSWPHVTADPVEKSRVQHNPLTKAARALRNTTTPGQTNREARVFQIEIVGTSHNRENAKGKTSVQDFTDEQLDWLGTHVFAPVAAATGTPLVTTVGWYGEDCGWTLASPTARQRLTAAQFDTYTGVLPHAVVPENEHWDCGPLNIDRILAAARGHILKPPPPKPPKDWFAMATKEELRKIVAEEIDKALSATADNQVAKDVRSLKRHTVVGATAAEGDPTVPERITSALARLEDATEQGKG